MLKCKENEANLKQADVPKAEALDQQIADMIDEAYDDSNDLIRSITLFLDAWHVR